MMRPEKAACGGRPFLFCAELRLGSKTPAGTDGEAAPAASRAQSRTRNARRRKMRPPRPRRGAHAIRAKLGSRATGRRAAAGRTDRTGTKRRGRRDMQQRNAKAPATAWRIMTIHDSLQRSGGVGCLPSARWTCSPPPQHERARSCWGACAIRVKPRSRRAGLLGGGGMDGPHRNGATRGGRYAGTEPRNVTRGMANMTSHDIFGSSAAGGGRPVPLAPCLPPFAEQGEQKGITAIGPAFDPVPPV